MLKATGSSFKNFIPINRPANSNSKSVATPDAPATDRVELGSTVETPQAPQVASNRPTIVEGEVMVKTKSSLFKSDQDSLLDSLGAKVKERFEFPADLFKSFEGEVLRLQLPDGVSTKQALAQLADDPRVEYAVPNEIIYLDEVVDEPGPSAGGVSDPDDAHGRKPDDLDSKLWGLHNRGQDRGTIDADIDAPEAWGKVTGSNDVVVAVIDTGIDYNHPDLVGNIWTNPGEIPGDGIDNDGNGVIDDIHGYNAFADDGDPMDGHSHGTHCAGTIAAQGNNGEGVAGVAWDAKLMGVKIFSDSGSTSSDAILRGILYAAKNGARITSNSWGGGGANDLIKEAFEKSTAFHVMAAGNNGRDVDRRENYPSGYEMPNSISVAATDRNDQLANFSNYGKKEVDIAAPGVQTYSTVPNGGYGFKSGTSMATPHVSGAAVLMVANNPSITNEELKSQLMAGAERLPSLRGKVASEGRLNVNNSLEQDNIAPGDLRNLQAMPNGAGEIGLSFLASGDDGYEGTASRYEVRLSQEPIQTMEQFLAATPYDVSKPLLAGTEENLRIAVAPSTESRNMHVAVRAFDNLQNSSAFARTTVKLPSADQAFAESVEVDTQGWTMDGKWGLETTQDKTVFSDSPGELSPNQANDSITSPVVDLSSFKNSALMFDTNFKLEQEYDQVHLEAARPAPEGQEQEWVELKSYTGTQSINNEVVDLSAFDGEQLQFRFRLTTDRSYTEDGFKFDNVRILGQKTA